MLWHNKVHYPRYALRVQTISTTFFRKSTQIQQTCLRRASVTHLKRVKKKAPLNLERCVARRLLRSYYSHHLHIFGAFHRRAASGRVRSVQYILLGNRSPRQRHPVNYFHANLHTWSRLVFLTVSNRNVLRSRSSSVLTVVLNCSLRCLHCWALVRGADLHPKANLSETLQSCHVFGSPICLHHESGEEKKKKRLNGGDMARSSII